MNNPARHGDATTRPPVRYHGGKWRLAPWIISHLPKHRIYVESFAGGGSVLLRKPRSDVEIYNDLDGEIVNIFRMARDRGDELMRRIELTPFARDEFLLSYESNGDPLEQARRTIARSFMGFGSAAICGETSGFRASATRQAANPSRTSTAMEWRNYPMALRCIIERMNSTAIGHASTKPRMPTARATAWNVCGSRRTR